MAYKPDKHGRDHCPGGEDPIPCLTGTFPTFRAAITDLFEDVTTERRDYTDNAQTDTIFWDYWEADSWDTTIFDPHFQPSGPDAGRFAALDLLQNGLYAIRVTIDWNDATLSLGGGDAPFNTWVGTNHDDGGVSHIYADMDSEIIFAWRTDQFRVVWLSFTGAEGSVEATAAHDLTGTVLYIPGGFAGYWAQPPMFTVAYLGPLDPPQDDFFADV